MDEFATDLGPRCGDFSEERLTIGSCAVTLNHVRAGSVSTVRQDDRRRMLAAVLARSCPPRWGDGAKWGAPSIYLLLLRILCPDILFASQSTSARPCRARALKRNSASCRRNHHQPILPWGPKFSTFCLEQCPTRQPDFSVHSRLATACSHASNRLARLLGG
jgi:hypothetical protein